MRIDSRLTSTLSPLIGRRQAGHESRWAGSLYFMSAGQCETVQRKSVKIVRYSKPQSELEKSFRFLLLDQSPAIDGISAKVTIQLICDDWIKPIEVVALDEVEAAQ